MLIHTANRGRIVSGCCILLIHVSFPFDFPFPNPMGFIPVDLGATYTPVGQTNERYPFQFTPAPTAVLPSQAHHFADGTPHGNGFNVSNVANDLEVHETVLYQIPFHIPSKHLTLALSRAWKPERKRRL